MPPPELITIAPGAGAGIRFTIVPARRPQTDGALAASLRLVYLAGSPSSFNLSDGGVSISTVTRFHAEAGDRKLIDSAAGARRSGAER